MRSKSAYGPLATRLLFTTVLGAVLPSLAAFGTYFVYRDARLEELASQHRFFAEQASKRIEATLASLARDLEALARARTALPAESMKMAQNLAHRNESIEDIFWTDAKGSETFRWDRTELVSAEELRDWSDTALFRELSESEIYWSPVRITELLEPVVTAAVPHLDRDGDLLGAVGATINVKILWELGFEYDIGPNAYAYVVDAMGRLIGHDNPSLVLRGIEAPGLAYPLRAEEEPISWSRSAISEIPVVYASGEITTTGWRIVVETSLRDALRVERRVLACTAVVIALSLLGTGWLGYWNAQRVARPVRELTEKAFDIAGEDALPTPGTDEVGLLSLAFSKMERGLREKEERLSWDAKRHAALAELERQTARLHTEEHIAELVADALGSVGIDAGVAVCTKETNSVPGVVSVAGSLAEPARRGCERFCRAEGEALDPVLVDGFASKSLPDGYTVTAIPTSSASAVQGGLAIVTREDRALAPREVELGKHMVATVAASMDRMRLRRRIEEERRYVEAVVASIPVAICIANAEGTITLANSAFATMAGVSVDDVVGRSIDDYPITDSGRTFADLDETSSWESVSSDDGRRREISWTITKRTNRKGDLVDALLTGTDLTHVRELESQLRTAQKLEAVGQLAGGVAHDFNNLLTVINGYCDRLVDRVAEDPSSKIAVERIAFAGQRAAALTQKLLAFGRKQFLRPEIVDLNELVTKLVPLLQRLLEESIDISVALGTGLAPVKVDTTQLEQILLNLVVNARDAMPDGGKLRIETANVTVSKKDPRDDEELAPGRYVQLTISDSGHGISDSLREHVFEPFFTTKEPGKGTGLGLATVYGIVKQSAGSVRLRETDGAGATFDVLLPAADGAASSDEPAPRERATRGSESVLVVEDDPMVRELMTSVLTDSGYRVLEASNANEAIALASEQNGTVDLLLTDTVMPGMSGPELALELRRSNPDLKVLVISGYSERGHTPPVPNATFLSKPFTPSVLAQTVRDVFEA